MSNVNDVKQNDVKITLLDGIERKLVFTLNAMAELEDKYGSVEAAFKALEGNSMKAVRFILWAGLMHHDEALTEQQVGNLIDIKLMTDLVESMGSAFESQMPVAPIVDKVVAIAEAATDPNV